MCNDAQGIRIGKEV